jgi:hypothetical protein
MSSKLCAAVSVFVLVAACQESATAPKRDYSSPNQSHPILLAASPQSFFAFAGDDVPDPTVRIVLSGTGAVVANLPVTFTFSDGKIERVTTDADGTSSTHWALDYSKSADSVIVGADGVPEWIKFKAFTVNKATVAKYELQSIGGHPLPIGYGGGGTSWTVTGGRYRLFDDSTYVFGYELDGQQRWGSPHPYFKRDSTIEFYLTPESAPQSSFYRNLNYLFSTGTLKGGVMSVKYTDYVDFEDETYALKQ